MDCAAYAKHRGAHELEGPTGSELIFIITSITCRVIELDALSKSLAYLQYFHYNVPNNLNNIKCSVVLPLDSPVM